MAQFSRLLAVVFVLSVVAFAYRSVTANPTSEVASSAACNCGESCKCDPCECGKQAAKASCCQEGSCCLAKTADKAACCQDKASCCQDKAACCEGNASTAKAAAAKCECDPCKCESCE